MGNKEQKQQKEKKNKRSTYMYIGEGDQLAVVCVETDRVQKFKMHIYLSENVLKETDQKYAKYVNVPYTRLQDFEAIYLLLFLVLPSFFESLLM